MEIDIDVLPIAISSLALLISAANWATSRRSQAQARTSLLNQMRGEWAALEPRWRIALASARTVIDAYTWLTLDERRRLATDLAFLDPEALNRAGLDPTRFPHEDREVQESQPEEVSVTRYFLEGGVKGEYYASFNEILEFLVVAADLLVDGRLKPREVYVLFGNEVARHGAAIRSIADTSELGTGAADVVQTHIQERPFDFRWPGPGRKERILFLLDVMWAELARRGDLDPHNLTKVAGLKATGSGLVCRRRARRLILDERGIRGLWAGLQMQRHLMNAELLHTSSLQGQGMGIVYKSEAKTTRATRWWRFRYGQRFVQGIPLKRKAIEFSERP